ncbi:MAG: protein kinase [Verrucomicrobia bacterium]|nr:protein kinase [Verrucomicrobiota bacterium]
MADSPPRPGPPEPPHAGAMLARGLEVTEPSRLGEPAMDELEELFPEYEFTGLISRGGFGTVYRARHRRLNRAMAVKVLTAKMSWDETTRRRFEREMKIAGQLDHPGVVRTFDAGERDGAWFLAMEFLDGADLSTVSRECGPLPVAEACEMVRQAALGLHYAHEQGLIHRDVKPGNLMLARHPDGTAAVKVLDFGIARAANPEAADLTVTQQFLGTLNYCAPEQIEHPGAVDLRADVFALGLTLHRLLTGVTPRDPAAGSSSLFERIRKLAHDAVPSVTQARPELPAELVAVVERMVALEPDKRFPNCAEAAAALAPFGAGHDLAALLGRVPVPKTAAELPSSASRSQSESSDAVELSLPAGLRRRGVGRLAWAGLAVFVLLAGWVLFQQKGDKAGPAAGSADADSIRLVDNSVRDASGIPAAPMTVLETFGSLKLPPKLSIAAGWRLVRVIKDQNPYAARFAPEAGEIIFSRQRTAIIAVSADGQKKRSLVAAPANLLAVSPDGRHLAWADPAKAGSIGRWDFAAAQRRPDLKYPDNQVEDNPKAVAFVPFGWSPAADSLASGVLRGGDVLVVNYNDSLDRRNVPGGVFRLRMDADQAGELVIPDASQVMVRNRGLAFTRDQMYALQINGGLLPNTYADNDPFKSVWRRGKTNFVVCATDRPIAYGEAITGDPGSGELFVLAGLKEFTPNACRVLHLTPAGGAGDRFTVQEVLDGISGARPAGLALSPDRRRLLVCDTAAHLIYELERPKESIVDPAPLAAAPANQADKLVPALAPAGAAARLSPDLKIAQDWRIHRVLPAESPRSPRYFSGGREIAVGSKLQEIAALTLVEPPARRSLFKTDVASLSFSSDQQLLVWAPPKKGRFLGRWDMGTGRRLPDLKLPASEKEELWKSIVFVPPGWEPGTDSIKPGVLRPGDALAPGFWQSVIHRFRMDSDQPPDRVVEGVVSGRLVNQDITFTRDQIYVIGMSEASSSANAAYGDVWQSVGRVQGTRLKLCQTDRPITSGVAIVGDAATGELFVLRGHSQFSRDCSLLRLSPNGGSDRFKVQEIVTGLAGGLSAGLDLSPDRRRLLVCDTSANLIYELERPAGPAAKATPLLTREQEKTIGLSPAESPVVMAAGWRLARFFPVPNVLAAAYNPQSGEFYYSTPAGRISVVATNGRVRQVMGQAHSRLLAVSPDGRHLASTGNTAAEGISRLSLDKIGGRPALLDCPPDTLEGAPKGLKFVPTGWVPAADSLPDNLLLDGDALILMVGKASRPGVYRFRMDSSIPPELIQAVPKLQLFPKDLAFTRDQLYVIRWIDVHDLNSDQELDVNNSSLWRFAGSDLLPCRLDRPLSTAVAFTADARTGELFVLCEAKKSLKSLPEEQTDCLWHLKPDGGPDKFTARLVLHSLKGVSGVNASISLSPDGRRVLVCDNKAGVIYELQRP